MNETERLRGGLQRNNDKQGDYLVGVKNGK